jgi:hypothetical protein
MRVQKWMLPIAGLLGTLAIVIAAFIVLGGSSDGNDDGAAATQERCAAGSEACDDSGGGNALGVCVEGVTNCVDTVVEPGGDTSVGRDEPLPDGDQPVTSNPNSGDLGDPGECSAVHNIEACEAQATELALADLSTRIGVEIEAIAVASAEPATWDGCLGIPPAEGDVCTEIGIPGYKIILEASAATYEYHTDQGTKAVLAP